MYWYSLRNSCATCTQVICVRDALAKLFHPPPVSSLIDYFDCDIVLWSVGFLIHFDKGFAMTHELPVLGSFSKGVEGAAQLNFGVSGGKHCDSGCRHHPDREGDCYAVAVEERADRQGLATKLARHELSEPATIVGRASIELHRMTLRRAVPWFRFSTNGSLPQPAQATTDNRFKRLLRELCQQLKGSSIPVHMPVESAEKATFYRAIVGDLVTVRESIQTQGMTPKTIADHAIPSGPCSFTAGESVGAGPDKLKRVLAAAAAAAKAWATRTGRRTIVCPAVRVSFLSKYDNGMTKEQKCEWRSKAKCGSCTACANELVDIVYPAHK